MTTFRQLLSGFEESAKTRAVQGRHFEQFCEAFFRLAAVPGHEFDKVWAWDDWPGNGGRGDTGIDLVAREAGSGDLVAIQCKFYSPTATLAWPRVSTFVGSRRRRGLVGGATKRSLRYPEGLPGAGWTRP